MKQRCPECSGLLETDGYCFSGSLKADGFCVECGKALYRVRVDGCLHRIFTWPSREYPRFLAEREHAAKCCATQETTS